MSPTPAATLGTSTRIGGRFARDLPPPEPGFTESADLYYRRPPKSLAYRHFESANAAIFYGRDNLNQVQIASAVLQVGEIRFEGAEVADMLRRLHAGPQQPAAVTLDA